MKRACLDCDGALDRIEGLPCNESDEHPYECWECGAQFWGKYKSADEESFQLTPAQGFETEVFKRIQAKQAPRDRKGQESKTP